MMMYGLTNLKAVHIAGGHAHPWSQQGAMFTYVTAQ